MDDIIYSFSDKLWNERSSSVANLPSTVAAQRFLNRVLGVFFPHLSERRFLSRKEIKCELDALKAFLTSSLSALESQFSRPAEEISEEFFNILPEVYEALVLDAEAIYTGDPAATSIDEVIAAYPGFFAISAYRIAHELHQMEVKLFARIITEYAHRLTGTDIHPGAKIGSYFCIDHATGIVIGETTEIGEWVKLYQGVTLGALSVDKSWSGRKRHPTVEKNVVIYSYATILGGQTTIGENSIVGGNVWLTKSIPPNSTVYHKGDILVEHREDLGKI